LEKKVEFFNFWGGATLFLMKNGRKFSDFVEQKKQFFVRLGGVFHRRHSSGRATPEYEID
jgi:hypothetical protein